jgi:hypothetical protein
MIEQESGPVQLRAIQIDLHERSITLEASDRTAVRLTYSPSGVLYELLGAAASAEDVARELRTESGTVATQEKQPTVTVTGKLKSQPRQGEPDQSGNPTAWAKLAVHDEGSDQAKLYSTTFHRHTARLALSLRRDDRVTVTGYTRSSKNPERMDSLSVFAFVAYPGKRDGGAAVIE